MAKALGKTNIRPLARQYWRSGADHTRIEIFQCFAWLAERSSTGGTYSCQRPWTAESAALENISDAGEHGHGECGFRTRNNRQRGCVACRELSIRVAPGGSADCSFFRRKDQRELPAWCFASRAEFTHGSQQFFFVALALFFWRVSGARRSFPFPRRKLPRSSIRWYTMSSFAPCPCILRTVARTNLTKAGGFGPLWKSFRAFCVISRLPSS